MACAYCYYLGKITGDGAANPRMSGPIADETVRQILSAHAGGRAVIAFQGGEPTLAGLPFYNRIMHSICRHRPAHTAVQLTFQTSGFGVTRDFARFFYEHQCLVGLSLDGPRRFHDAFRVRGNGQGTYDVATGAARLLTQHRVDFNVLCTVNEVNAAHGREVYRCLRDDVGARFLQFIPVVGAARGSVAAAAFGAFLCEVFDEWRATDIGRVFVQNVESALAAMVGAPPLVCTHAPTCGVEVVVEQDGSVYACDHAVDAEHKLGNVMDQELSQLIASPFQRAFGNAKSRLPADCLTCRYLSACHGGCPLHRDVTGKSALCDGYRTFYRYAEPLLASLAAQLARTPSP